MFLLRFQTNYYLLKRNFIVPIRLLRYTQVSGAVGGIFSDFIGVVPWFPHNRTVFELPLDDPFKLFASNRFNSYLRGFCKQSLVRQSDRFFCR